LFMSSGIPSLLLASGISAVFTYPGYPVEELLARLDATGGIDVVVNAAESSAVAAAHAYWLTAGRPAAVLLSDGAGIEAATAMLALAVREGAGLIVILPGLLPGASRSGGVLQAIGAVVVDFEEWEVPAAVALAATGKVVAAVPGFSTQHDSKVAPPRATASHHALFLGPLATGEELKMAAAHTCPIITASGVRPPSGLRSRWIGSVVLGSHPCVFDLAGLGNCSGRVLAEIGCPPSTQHWLDSIGSTATAVPAGMAGVCESGGVHSDSEGADGFLLCRTLAAVGLHLPEATMVTDAGAGHRMSAYAARRVGSPIVSTLGPTTMGWGPGAGLGTALATKAPVILSIGDGSLAMVGLHFLEWQRYGVAGVIVSAKNGSLGSVAARMGEEHRRLTACDLAPETLWKALQIPWQEVPAGTDPAGAAKWAAEYARKGGLAALVVDTKGLESEEYKVPSGLHWWDNITNAARQQRAGSP
jgi:hypothetical protein